MTPDEHAKERMRHWTASYIHHQHTPAPGLIADAALNAFDARFPAPSAAAPVEPVAKRPPLHAPFDDVLGDPRVAVSSKQPVAPNANFGEFIGHAELAALRQKAELFDKLCEELPPGWKLHLRCWDAVASGKLGIYPRDGDFAVHWDVGHSVRPTAAEAVQAAIDAGALK